MKYEITAKELLFDGVILHQIKALRDIPARSVTAGSLGGYIEKESNLSQEGDCWVYPSARVLEDATVLEDSSVRNTSVLRGTAVIKGNSALRGRSLMIIDELDDNMILMHEVITKNIKKESPRNGVHWGTWCTDTELHCDCISHPFEVWDKADDDFIKDMHKDAIGWWKSQKGRLMKDIKSNRKFGNSKEDKKKDK